MREKFWCISIDAKARYFPELYTVPLTMLLKATRLDRKKQYLLHDATHVEIWLTARSLFISTLAGIRHLKGEILTLTKKVFDVSGNFSSPKGFFIFDLKYILLRIFQMILYALHLTQTHC